MLPGLIALFVMLLMPALAMWAISRGNSERGPGEDETHDPADGTKDDWRDV